MNFRPYRRSIRLPEYDYSRFGYYYVTICTKNRELYFENNKIKQIIQQHWLEIPKHFKNIELDEYVVMPNHLHGIIVINVGAIHESPANKHAIYKRAIRELPLQEDRRQMLLPKIIGRFKMNSTKYINILLNQPGQPLWQRNYYEHIIRDKQSLNRIRHYIKTNPKNWETDRNNPKNWHVIAIIGVIASIVLVATKSARDKARIVKGLQFSASVHHALGAYAVGIWDFDDGTATDYSGHEHDGTINEAVPVADTPSGEGQALSFDGSNDYVYAEVGDWLGVSNTPWTVSAWFKSPNSGGPIIGITSNPPSGGWTMPFMSLASDGILYGWAWNGGRPSSNVGFNKWICGVVVYDPSEGIKLYVNGELADSSSDTNYLASGTTDYWTTYTAGAKPPNVPSYFKGIIDDVRIYERALSSAQIRKLYVEGAKEKGLVIK